MLLFRTGIRCDYEVGALCKDRAVLRVALLLLLRVLLQAL
jgi:hypothetical protein